MYLPGCWQLCLSSSEAMVVFVRLFVRFKGMDGETFASRIFDAQECNLEM